MDFDHTVNSNKTFPSVVSAVQENIAKAGMRVLYIHDVQQNLQEKCFNFGPFKIIEFCNAKYAHDFLQKEMKIGLCMPCKINVYVKNGQTMISGMRPIMLKQFFPEVDLEEKPEEVDELVRKIVEDSK